MYTIHLVLVYLCKHMHINPSWKLTNMGESISYQNRASYQYQVIHSIRSRQNYRFLNPFWKILGREVVFITIFYFFYSIMKFKCRYEILRHVCVLTMLLRWPLRPVGLLFISRSHTGREIRRRLISYRDFELHWLCTRPFLKE